MYLLEVTWFRDPDRNGVERSVHARRRNGCGDMILGRNVGEMDGKIIQKRQGKSVERKVSGDGYKYRCRSGGWSLGWKHRSRKKVNAMWEGVAGAG